MKITITRKTRLGFGWSSFVEQVNDRLVILPPTGPDYVGTIKTLRAKIASDANYQVSRNTCSVASCFFVKIGGTWKKIRGDFYLEVYFPLYKDYPRKSSVEVEVED